MGGSLGLTSQRRISYVGAIKDFTGAIAIYPNYGDTWKRRGQARSADGDSEGATTVSLLRILLISCCPKHHATAPSMVP